VAASGDATRLIPDSREKDCRLHPRLTHRD
jgi:hypothetical protein